MQPPLTVSIPALVVDAAANYVTFRLLVAKGEAAWSAQRRFTDFEKLHAAVRRWAGAEPLPELPPKHSLRVGQARFDPTFLEERRSAVDDFLQYAQYRLREAVESMSGIPETGSLVGMLREAVRVAEEGRGGAGGRAWARRGSGAGELEAGADEDGAAQVGSPGGGGGGSGGGSGSGEGGPGLLPLLSSAVAALREYRGVLAGRAEDCEARAQACASSTSSLQVKLRDRRVDLEEATAALQRQREERARECARERAQLGVLGAKVRLCGAEVARVDGEARFLEALNAAASAAATRLRGVLATWEAGGAAQGGGEGLGGGGGGGGSSPKAVAAAAAASALAREAARVEDPLVNISAYVKAAESAIGGFQAAGGTLAGAAGERPPCVPFAAVAQQQQQKQQAAAANFPQVSLAGPDLSLGLLLQAVAADSARLLELARSASGSVAAATPLRPLTKQQAASAQPRSGGALIEPPSSGTAAAAAGSEVERFSSRAAAVPAPAPAPPRAVGNPFGAAAQPSNPSAAAAAPAPTSRQPAGNPFAAAPAAAPQRAKAGNPF